MKPTSGILLYVCAKHKHALGDGWKRGQVNLKADVFFSQMCINSQSNLTAYNMKKMDIFAPVDDGIKKCYHSTNGIFYMFSKRERQQIAKLIYSFCSVVMFLQIKLFHNDLFSVLHYL